jgi:hypothetical protein
MMQTEITGTDKGRCCGGETVGQMRRRHTEMDKGMMHACRAGRSGVIQKNGLVCV